MKINNLLSAFFWLLYAMACIVLAITLAFYFFGYFDYGYGIWYSLLGIDEHLATYASQNTLKPQFHLLSAAEHQALFSHVATSVHSNGKGLEELTYLTDTGLQIRLFHQAEIQHLQDVALLFKQAKLGALCVLLIWPLLAYLVLKEGRTSWWQRSLSLSLVFTPLLLWLGIAGPTQVFYQFHEWVFPAENAWFFYWEESHMSAMMKAPYLFGVIAIEIALCALLLTPLVHGLGLKFALRLRTLIQRP